MTTVRRIPLRRAVRWLLLVVALALAVRFLYWGQPQPRAFTLVPVQPGQWRITHDGNPGEVWQAFDVDDDGVLDRFVTPDGEWTRPSRRHRPPRRWLVVCIDAVPFGVMEELWQRGHFREFHRPSALVSTFPSDSELAIAAALHAPPGPGYEHQYFDRAANRLRGGVFVTLSGRSIPYLPRFDYVAPGWHKSVQYVLVRRAWHAEMGRLRQRFRETQKPVFHAHVSSGDPLFHRLPRAEAQSLLIEFEHVIREAYYAGRGELGVLLWSDHGNSLVRSRSVPLDALLHARGWRRSDALRAPRDVVIPAYGLVGFFVAYCAPEAVAELAADLSRLEGAELVLYRGPEPNVAVLLGTGGRRARLRWNDAGTHYRYEPEQGDPIELEPVLAALAAAGRLDAEGWVADADLFAATARARLPDAVARIRTWAGTTQVENPSDIVVSLKPGYYQGRGWFDRLVTMEGTHGALERDSSLGFAMGTDPLPETLRLRDLLPAELQPRN
ncbi:MAG: hypothetical protein K6U02_09475 [Firmicutes bacterium]|nr:hypothetical protein [Bacillota bacterium]